MALWDYMQKRMQELGLTAYKLQKDYDVPWSTIQRSRKTYYHAVEAEAGSGVIVFNGGHQRGDRAGEGAGRE